MEDDASVSSNYSNAHVSSGPLKCSMCDKRFTYRKALMSHEQRHQAGELEVKTEPPDGGAAGGLLDEAEHHSDTESSQEGDDNTCDICEKQFSYRRLLVHHKRTKHNMSSGTKRAKINLKSCAVRCLICDLEMRVSEINAHNQKHTSVNVKPRNLYTCAECEERFKSCSALANHIKLVHRLKRPQQAPKLEGAQLADFCEVVVTKAEPLVADQSRNGPGTVPPAEGGPLVDLSGFTCPICGKQMPTLVSLKRHVNWHSNVGNNIEKKLECFVCKEVSSTRQRYILSSSISLLYLDPKIQLYTITIV